MGDSALTIGWPDEGSLRPCDIAQAAARIREAAIPGVAETVPAYRTLTVILDRGSLGGQGETDGWSSSLAELADRLLLAVRSGEDAAADRPVRVVKLNAAFGGEAGPDLADCAARSGMGAEEFVNAYASNEYVVQMIGFAPGFPYLSGLPEKLAQPRRDSPRRQVPAGSIGIAGAQTGVYPMASPGGWQLIGRIGEPLFRPEAEEPFLLAPGDRVVFVPGAFDGGGKGRAAVDADAKGSASPKTAGTGGTNPILTVVKPGLFTTVQDAGRPGWRAYGVSAGGAMDAVSMRTANALVGNEEDAAVLEMTLSGGEFRVEKDLLAAICGAEPDARADGEPVPANRPVWLRAGTMLSFGSFRGGCRAYLAVAGGFDVPAALGSRSTDTRAGIGGVEGRALVAGDRLCSGGTSPVSDGIAARLKQGAANGRKACASVPWRAEGVRIAAADCAVLRVLPGEEWQDFTEESRSRLFEQRFRVETASDRMGVRLAGEPLRRIESAELLSHGVVPGTVQVPSGGQPIVLAAGCQPTGGYPKIAQVIEADWPVLAQCAPGREVRFALVDADQAWEAWRQTERRLRLLKAGVRLRFRQEGALE